MQSFSDLILKKGPLSPIWIAGTTTDKLGKKMVLATDITTLAKRIMEEERVNLVLRLSGMLLKGLVIVYSKKMQYMLTDCEEIINKIKLSFKPGQIDLQDSGKKNKDDAVTIVTDISEILKDQDIEISKWINTENPEEYFVVAHPQINFITPEVTPIVTDVSSDSGTQSSSSSQISINVDDFGPAFIPKNLNQNENISKWKENEFQAQWEPLPDDDDNDIILPSNSDEDNQNNESEPSEPLENLEIEKKGKIIFDNKTEISENRKNNQRIRRTVNINNNKNINSLTSNSLFDALFDESRKLSLEKSRNKDKDLNIESTNDYNDDFEGFAIDSEVEVDRANDKPMIEIPSISEDDELLFKKEGIGSSDVQFEIGKRPSESGEISPMLISSKKNIELESPFPNLKFAIEQTPRRTAEDSISSDTIKTLNKLKISMSNSEMIQNKSSITFNEAFLGSNRHMAALSFYQILVLKSTGTINVKQENPFQEIEIFPISDRFWKS